MGEALRSRTVLCLLVSPAGLLAAGEPWGPGDNDILLSEVHYHPAGDEKTQEFIELHNAGVRWVDLGGWRFTSGIEFTFPAGTVLEPGGYLVVARDAAALRAARKVENVLGDWKGALKNGGAILELRNRTDRAVASLHYRDGRGEKGGLWPERPDGDGPSLELIQPHPDWHRPWYWAPSRAPGGTPGRENSRHEARAAAKPGQDGGKTPRRLRLNEVRLEEEGAFIEILNDGEAPEKLDGLKLTCGLLGEGGVPLTGTVARRKHHVVPAETLAPLLAQLGPAAEKGKAAPRPRLYLLAAEGLEIVDTVAARRGARSGASFGRFPDGTGAMVACARATPGAPNPAPAPSDLVIHEIHYHGAGADDEEFIEIFNRGKAAVSLEGWALERAVSFEFPAGASIPPGGFVVAAASPEKVRARVTGAAGRVFGPFRGKLSNSGDVVVLCDAAGDEADRVEYSDGAPWPPEADGGGYSIELIDPGLDNRWPQAWTTGALEGTPCGKSARAIKSMPPAIGGVRHSPAVPAPEDGVIIHAQVVDTGSISNVSVIYRDLASRSAPVRKAMADGGKLEDGAARDGHYTVRLPRFRAGTLVGYSIVARDGSGRETRAPAEPGRDIVFQVEDPRSSAAPSAGGPVYRILMPPADWDQFLRSRPGETRYACTLVASIEGPGVNEREGEVFHEASIRYRGKTSFNAVTDGRWSYRVFLGGGQRHDGRDRLILNAFDSFRQKAAGDLMRWAGLPVSNTDVVRLKTLTFDDGRYVDVEVISNEFLDDKLGSSAGRIFRGMPGADLADHGAEADRYLTLYAPVNRKGDRDTRSLLGLIRALDTRDDTAFADAVEKVLDPAEWAAYFAANHLVGNDERGLNSGVADDYFLAERPPDGKYLLLPWDQNETFKLPALAPFTFRHGRLRAATRFLEHPRFAPLYHRALRELLDGPFSRSSFARWKAYHGGTFRVEDVALLERFVERRQTFLRARYPLAPRAGVQPAGEAAASGFGTRTFLASAADTVLVHGLADPAVAFRVRVAGVDADYDPVRGHWSWQGEPGLFAAGPNALWVESLGPGAEPVEAYPINIERVPGLQAAPPSIEGKTEWTRENGPVLLRGNAVVAAASVLRIGPGVDVICAPGSSLTVRGTLLVEGSAREPVTFRPAARGGSWSGIRFLRGGSGKASALAHCRFEGGRAASAPPDDSAEGVAPALRGADSSEPGAESAGHPGLAAFIRADGAKLQLERCLLRGIAGTAIHLEAADVEARGLSVSACEVAISARGGVLRLDGAAISDVHADGLVLSSLEGESAVRGAVVRDVQGSGISIEGGKVTLEGCLVHGCASGVAVSGGARARISRSTLAGNARGLVVDPPRVVVTVAPRRTAAPIAPGRSPAPVPRGPETQVVIAPAESQSDVEIVHSVLGPCLEPIAAAARSRLSVASSIVQPDGGDPPRGEGVMSAVPRFAAAHRGDFRLAKGSPGEGKGPGGASPGWPGDAAR
jgi:hypothetical protein